MDLVNHLERFAQDLSSPYWWVSVVVVGFLINLASAYVKPWLDARFSKFSAKRRRALELLDQHFQEESSFLKKHPTEMFHFAFDEIRSRTKAAVFLILTPVLWTTSTPGRLFHEGVSQHLWFPVFVSILVLVLVIYMLGSGLNEIWRARYLHAILEVARKRERKETEEPQSKSLTSRSRGTPQKARRPST